MTMRTARILIVVIGLLLPYAARLPRGLDWVQQYAGGGLGASLFLGVFNALAWGALLAVSFFYQRPVSLLAPALAGFGFLAWAHGSLSLAADAQSAIALVFIPLYALVPILVGAVVGALIDRRLRAG
ncbi:hypothetical protein [Myxococcus vastator]|uniref:hypothetical protein n=1 Tax=Myxococcus vastator TaxID=2709664 RepID=UPI0013D7E1B0|nr:hypothetical protein [Myxococcus vastator]